MSKLNIDFENILNKVGKDKIFIVVLIGILLMVIALPVSNNSGSTKADAVLNDTVSGEKMYEEYIEDKLGRILSNVEGVGKVQVMINFKHNTEDEGVYSRKFYSSSDDTPYIVMEHVPDVEGVIIVCEGEPDKKLVTDITEAVYGLLNVPIHKIKVMKMSN